MIKKTTLVVMAAGMGSREQALRHGARDLLLQRRRERAVRDRKRRRLLRQQHKASVRVYKNADKWYGITYREDLQEVKDAIGGYIRDGLYKNL